MIILDPITLPDTLERGVLGRAPTRDPGPQGLRADDSSSAQPSQRKQLPIRRTMQKPLPRRKLGRGTQGPDVKILQARLNERGKLSPPLKTDGVYGDKTWNEVVRFQRWADLTPSGMLLRADWIALYRRLTRPGPKVNALPHKRRLEDFEISLEGRLGRLFQRVQSRIPDRQMADQFSGDPFSDKPDARLTRVADVICNAVSTSETSWIGDERLLGLELSEIATFRAVFRNFSEMAVLATSSDELNLATLLLGDLLELVTTRQLINYVYSFNKGSALAAKQEAPARQKGQSNKPRQPRPKAPAQKEPDTFDNVDQDQQAQALESAARDGTPFCEECEKARKEKRQAA